MKKKLLQKAGVILLSIACGVFGFLAARYGLLAAKHLPASVGITLIILLIPAFFLAIAVHEAGHALAGIWLKFDFRMYVVGPFLWEKETTGWKFRWNKNVNISGGLVLCIPVQSDDLGKRFAMFAAGGPLASLALTGISFGTYKLLLVTNAADAWLPLVLAHFFGITAMFSLLIFIFTAIPVHTNGFSSDGARVLRLLRGGDIARFEMLILKIVASSWGGTRPSSLNQEELKEGQRLALKLNAPFGVYLHSFFHQAAFDRGDIEKAESHLEDYVREADAIPKGIRSAVWLDAAFFYAYARKDLDKANYYWNKFTPSAMIPKAQVFATEAAIGNLRNDKALALAKVDAATLELTNMIDQGVAISLRDKLIALRHQLSQPPVSIKEFV